LGVIYVTKITRPKILNGTTEKLKTGCGSLYVTICLNGDKPIEVFAKLGKAGGCSSCQNEALTRAITLGLKHGVSVRDFIDELKGLRCPNPNMIPKEDVCLSCADGIARALQMYDKETDEKAEIP